ncbi:MAG: hypothetical protein JSW27_25955 [Phycisphaerales bacterium]|nr:MAG: hypothetical protein JSW27_25955 [Phycisphaerales bacterium]
MVVRRAFLCLVVLLAIATATAVAQESLGDLVAQGGYDWLIGKWVATTDEGDQLTYEQKWALDRHVILVDFKMRNFQSAGMIIFVPSREEVIQVGADNQGGTWKGTWRDEYGSAVHAMEHTRADGQVQKAEIVHTRVDAETMKAAMYGLSGDGYRVSEPWHTLTYKRQKAGSAGSASAGQDSGGASQGSLGDMLSQYGYEWILGQWQGTDDQGRTAQVTYGLTLDKHAGLVSVQMGPFAYRGLVMFVPAREEVIQIGADNMGGYWKGTWSEDYEGLVNRHERMQVDGSTEKMEHVYVKIDGGTIKIKQYAVEAGGSRASTPRAELTVSRAAGGATPK